MGTSVMRREELVVGETYFMVTYADGEMVAPIVITYRYLGTDLGEVAEDSSQYHFRYLPAFQVEGESHPDAAWREMFPALFTGWGENMPTSFEESKLSGLLTIDGLISELSACRDRQIGRKR
jgi:hypothetical protein